MLYRTLKGILLKICSFPVSLHSSLKGVFHRIQTIFYLSKPRIPADPLIPLENSAPKPSDDDPSLKQALLISNPDGFDYQALDCSTSSRTDADSAVNPSEVKNIVDSVTICIPNFSNHALDYYASSSNDTESAVIIQKYVPQKIASYAEHLEALICISTEEKCEESSEGEKVIIESATVVEKGRWITHYSSCHRILLVGEGDFSFSCSLAVAFGCASKMVATSLDSKDFLKKNYSKAPRNIVKLQKRGCIVMHEIDATAMATHQLLKHKTFDRIIFNFPFAGFFSGLSRDSSLRRHRRLVSMYLKNAKEMINEDGEIHISHKTNGYHREWKLVSIASSHGLRLIEEVAFALSDYPGYNTKRGFGGDKNFNCYPSNTYKFGLKFVDHDYGKW